MKKFTSIVLLLAVLLSCCACNKGQSGAEPETTLDFASPEVMYGHIDQSGPINGVFQIWSLEGVKNMSKYPDANFELLCNIDAQGAVIAPLGSVAKPFTGRFNGGNNTISNLTVKGGEDGAFGFIGVNKGTVENLYLKDVTFQPDAKAVNIGGIAGINEGTIKRSSLEGNPLELSQIPENANCGAVVGVNKGELNIVSSTVDMKVTASKGANLGGIAGLSSGGHMEYVDTCGKLDVIGTTATVGLYTGTAENTSFLSCCFIGETNTVDGKLFTNFSGQETEVSYENCLWRDNEREPLPENVQKVREKAVQKMRDMGTVEWRVNKDLVHNCKCNTTYVCDGTYVPDYTYIGMPYKHGSGSLDSFYYCLDENNYMKDFVYEMDARNGFDSYIGSMCSSASQMAWWSVSNSVDHIVCQYMLPPYPEYGCIPVGTGWYENAVLNSNADTAAFIESCDEQVYFEALVQARPGDCIVNGLKAGDHVRMVSMEPVVVRDQDGKIDGERSYLTTHEQRGSYTLNEENKTWTSWRIDYQYNFNWLKSDAYVPVTIEELLTGEMEPAECTMLNGVEGKLGMTTGTVKANYYLESVTMNITDSEGNVVMDRIVFPKTAKFDHGNARYNNLSYIDSYNMANFATVLQDVMFEPGETYSYTVSAKLATGDTFTVVTDSFTQGGTK